MSHFFQFLKCVGDSCLKKRSIRLAAAAQSPPKLLVDFSPNVHQLWRENVLTEVRAGSRVAVILQRDITTLARENTCPSSYLWRRALTSSSCPSGNAGSCSFGRPRFRGFSGEPFLSGDVPTGSLRATPLARREKSCYCPKKEHNVPKRREGSTGECRQLGGSTTGEFGKAVRM